MVSALRKRAACLLLSLACGSCGGCGDESGPRVESLPTPARASAAAPDAAKLLEEGYALKREGRNGAALERFERACALLERTAGPRDRLFASCLDDKATVMVRTGRYQEARELYERSLRILERHPAPVLREGISWRMKLLDHLGASGVRCAEPAEPRADDPLPYFPDVGEMQTAIGRLGIRLRGCDTGGSRLVTTRITITGDGKPLMIEIHGREADTAVGRCIEKTLSESIRAAELPRFSACYRPFTFPFAVGLIPAR